MHSGWVGLLTRREWLFPTPVIGGKINPGVGYLGKEDGEQWRVVACLLVGGIHVAVG